MSKSDKGWRTRVNANCRREVGHGSGVDATDSRDCRAPRRTPEEVAAALRARGHSVEMPKATIETSTQPLVLTKSELTTRKPECAAKPARNIAPKHQHRQPGLIVETRAPKRRFSTPPI